MTPVPEWNPTTNGEIALKVSLEKLAASTDRVLLTPAAPSLAKTKEQEKQQVKPQGLCPEWQELPPTNDEFDKKISKDAFKRLEAVDKSIYDDTKNMMVGIGMTCGAFYDDNLFQIVQAGTVAKTWTEDTLENLQAKEVPAMGLHAQLMLGLLEQTAVKKSAEATNIVTALLKFKADTTPFAKSLEKLIPKYSKTPLTFDDKTVNGYLAYLNADYDEAMKNLSQALGDYNSKYDDWKTATGVAISIGVSFGWMPLYGWATLAFVAHKADTLHTAWQALWENYESLEMENEKEARLIDFVTTIVGQVDDIDKKIQGAIQAAGTLSSMLQEQADAYSGINSTLAYLSFYTSSTDPANRQLFIEGKLQVAITQLEVLHPASEGFMNAIFNEDPNFMVPTSLA
ncbi:hypothetical protein BDP55DRAFT_720175 [Colletotrichum godetiae]|uniref:Uncharacterized protein n=1 Tax=Colletotrichum godetiae TaxID=1209918 RepID=A0AAJ0ADT0_9PEZI|nr:uncharacterized protein BDP55DRAFT_720175 [Colletotrichum godetiae]KAK1659110.1 hypothetical protein BDP55DRAFT_720175 [Colletotrichum godetiae]